MSEATYIVQVKAEGEGAWRDVANVSVASRTHRKTVIAKAIEDADLTIEGPLLVRVLGEESARVTVVTVEQPPPQLRIG